VIFRLVGRSRGLGWQMFLNFVFPKASTLLKREKEWLLSYFDIIFCVLVLSFSYFNVTCLEIKYLRLEREEIYKKLFPEFSSGKIILIKRFQHKQMAAKLPQEVSKDWEVMDLDPVTEVKGNEIVRNFERKMSEFCVTRVVFFRALMVMAERLVPNCKGHEKYGVVEEGNIPVGFRHHLPEKLPIYAMFKNRICRPIRVPETGDKMMVGIKWRATETSILLEAQKGSAE